MVAICSSWDFETVVWKCDFSALLSWLLSDTVSGKLQNNNIYTIAKRNVEGQDMLYQSLKLTNGIWILAELRIQPGNPNYTVRFMATSFPLSPVQQAGRCLFLWARFT